MPNVLLVCRDASRPVGVVIMEAQSMLEAYTNAVARGLAADASFGEAYELGAKMMKSVPPTQIGKMMSGVEAAQMIGRLVERREKPEEMPGRFPRPWCVIEHSGYFTVQDARGQNVAWFYFRNDPGVVPSVAARFKDEARRRAMIFALQPETLIETNLASADQAPAASTTPESDDSARTD
jgi:hypothetical protein